MEVIASLQRSSVGAKLSHKFFQFKHFLADCEHALMTVYKDR